MNKKTLDPQSLNLTKGRPRQAVLLALGAAALLLVPAVASAQPAPAAPSPATAGPGGGHGWRGGQGRHGKGMRGKGMHGRKQRFARMQKALGLTPAQVQQMKAVRTAQKQQMATLRLAKTRIRAAMRVEWLKDQPDQAALRALQQKLSNVMTKKAKLRFEGRLKITSILTPAQRLKAKQLGLTMGKGGRGHGRFGKNRGHGRFGKGRGHGQGRFGKGRGGRGVGGGD